MMDFLDTLAAPTLWLLAQPSYICMTIIGILLCISIIVCGLAFAMLPLVPRRSPLWSLAIMAPPVFAGLLWILAYKKWPEKKLVK